MSHSCCMSLIVMLSAVITTPTLAQTWPVKPVRVVTNYTAGGATDVVARAVAQKLSEATGQPVIVENRPSVNGVVGTQDVARTRPDGYNLLFSTAAHTSISRALLGDKLPFDPFKDLTPITLRVVSPRRCSRIPGWA